MTVTPTPVPTPLEVLMLETFLIAAGALGVIVLILAMFENHDRYARRLRRRFEDRALRASITTHHREMKRLARTTRKP